MFDQLSDRLLGTIRTIRGQSKITESNIDEAIKEIRRSLLEADVHFKIVKNFTDRVKEKALGAEVLQSITAGQQFVKIVHDELVKTLGVAEVPLDVRQKLSCVMLVGLQGTGKTTSAAKLALFIRQKLKKKPGLVPLDVYRPAAIEQLTILAKANNLP